MKFTSITKVIIYKTKPFRSFFFIKKITFISGFYAFLKKISTWTKAIKYEKRMYHLDSQKLFCYFSPTP